MYKYTFNKLNSGLGLIGKRLVKIINKFHNFLKKNKINFHHYLYYGDFEAFSEDNCKRLKIDERQFLEKLQKSCKLMKKKIGSNISVNLLVQNLSNKKNWNKMCLEQEKKISKIYVKKINAKRIINEISISRNILYSSWYPNMKEQDYYKIVIKQGAEYTSMAHLFKKKFKNPMVLGLDHPKMSYFYNIEKPIPVVYGSPRYV